MSCNGANANLTVIRFGLVTVPHNQSARAMLYFSIRYEMPIDDDEEEDLRRWHAEDSVDQVERRRAAAATEAQGNANPFIDDPKLVTRIADF